LGAQLHEDNDVRKGRQVEIEIEVVAEKNVNTSIAVVIGGLGG
jgi:hypothetical protein